MILSPEYTLYLKSLIGVLAIVNPLGAIPVFISLSADRSQKETKQIAKHSAIAVAVILILSIWMGDKILSFFGISISSFQAGGGLLIVLMAINMLHAKQSNSKQTSSEANEATEKENIAVVPLAIPLMAGPGAISLVIIDAHLATHWIDRLFYSANVLIVALVVWLVLRLATPIGTKLGTTGLNIATRVMGLLLAAIGFQMLTTGLIKLLPGLA